MHPANLTALKQAGAQLLELIDDMDLLLGAHHATLLGKPWLTDAESWAAKASTPEHSVRLMEDARRVITLWGHPDAPTDTHDSRASQYSYRLWQGLVSKFYRPRWATFIGAVETAVGAGHAFDAAAQDVVTRELTLWAGQSQIVSKWRNLDLRRVPYVSYGVKYICLVSLMPDQARSISNSNFAPPFCFQNCAKIAFEMCL